MSTGLEVCAVDEHTIAYWRAVKEAEQAIETAHESIKRLRVLQNMAAPTANWPPTEWVDWDRLGRDLRAVFIGFPNGPRTVDAGLIRDPLCLSEPADAVSLDVQP